MNVSTTVQFVTTPQDLRKMADLLDTQQTGPGAEVGCKNNVTVTLPGFTLILMNEHSPDVQRMLQKAAQPQNRIIHAPATALVDRKPN